VPDGRTVRDGPDRAWYGARGNLDEAPDSRAAPHLAGRLVIAAGLWNSRLAFGDGWPACAC
jgi:hypothetical protein